MQIEATTIRHASCRCGQLTIACSGDPVRISVCHCYDCQKRSGSAFAVQARFGADGVTVRGKHICYTHAGDSGNSADFHFCPQCGGTLWYHAQPYPAHYAIPVGAFADRGFPMPAFSVWEDRRHPWLSIVGEGVEHFD